MVKFGGIKFPELEEVRELTSFLFLISFTLLCTVTESSFEKEEISQLILILINETLDQLLNFMK